MSLGDANSYLDPAEASDRPAVAWPDARRTAHVPTNTHGTSSVLLARYTSTSTGTRYAAVLVWAFITTGVTMAGAGPSTTFASGCTEVWLANAQSGADLGGVSWCPGNG